MNTEIETYKLIRDGKRDLSVTGTIVATASSRIGRDGQSQNRWTVLTLYKTKSGKFVVQSVGHTLWMGESTRYAATVCENEEAVVEALTQNEYLSELAKELLDDAHIDYSDEVE
jgi:hypothetical protein